MVITMETKYQDLPAAQLCVHDEKDDEWDWYMSIPPHQVKCHSHLA